MKAVWYHSFGNDSMLVLEKSRRDEARAAMYAQTAIFVRAATLPFSPQALIMKTAMCSPSCASTAASSSTTIATCPLGLSTTTVDFVCWVKVGRSVSRSWFPRSSSESLSVSTSWPLGAREGFERIARGSSSALYTGESVEAAVAK